MFELEKHKIYQNTFRLTKSDLMILFSIEFCIIKSAKVILRVKTERLKIYPQNDKGHFKGRKNMSKKLPLKQQKPI